MRPRRRLSSIPFGRGRALEYAERVENEDGTFDLIGVEILSTGGPVIGVGSPPEGDFWSLDELRGMAIADSELGDEIKPPNKIGHPDEQTLIANSIDAGELPSDGEMPAVGWLEDLRVSGEKLLADVKRVPRVVCEAIDTGAYRTRSVELSRLTSQTSGKTYDWVVTGLAWLGGKMPAVRTIGDVVNLYEGDVPIRRRVVVFDERELAEGDVAWSPDEGYEGIRNAIAEALNPGPYDAETPARYWVRDVADGKALVEDWAEEAMTAWIVGYTMDGGRATLEPSGDWVKAEEAWVEVARANSARRLTVKDPAADTRTMKFSDKQRRKFAEATGLEVEKVTDQMLEDAGVGEEPAPDPDPTPDPAPAPDPAPTPEPEADSETKKLEARLTGMETELRLERRNSFIENEAIGKGKIEPGQRQDLEALFDLDPDRARSLVDGLPARDDLLEELGRENADDDDDDPATRSFAHGEGYKDSAAERLGISQEAIV